MQVKRQQLEPDMKQWTGSKSGKEYQFPYLWSAALHCTHGMAILGDPGADEMISVVVTAARLITLTGFHHILRVKLKKVNPQYNIGLK